MSKTVGNARKHFPQKVISIRRQEPRQNGLRAGLNGCLSVGFVEPVLKVDAVGVGVIRKAQLHGVIAVGFEQAGQVFEGVLPFEDIRGGQHAHVGRVLARQQGRGGPDRTLRVGKSVIRHQGGFGQFLQEGGCFRFRAVERQLLRVDPVRGDEQNVRQVSCFSEPCRREPRRVGIEKRRQDRAEQRQQRQSERLVDSCGSRAAPPGLFKRGSRPKNDPGQHKGQQGEAGQIERPHRPAARDHAAGGQRVGGVIHQQQQHRRADQGRREAHQQAQHAARDLGLE